jgi:hypothetical protein
MDNTFDAGILKKLRVNEQSRILIINAPGNYVDIFASMNPDISYNPELRGKYDFVQVFGACRTELESLLLHVREAGKYDASFWACYPKGTGKIKSDLKREIVWASLELIRLRPVSQIALNDTWSALRGRPHELVNR